MAHAHPQQLSQVSPLLKRSPNKVPLAAQPLPPPPLQAHFEPAYTKPLSGKEAPRHVNKKMDQELQTYQREVEAKFQKAESRLYTFPRVKPKASP